MTESDRKFWYRDVFYPKIVVAKNQSEASAAITRGTLVVVQPSDRPKSVKFLCPCGCGEVLSINVMRGAGKAWRIVFDLRRGLSLYPSVWLDVGCESHFILRDNTARLLFGRMPEMSEDEEAQWLSTLPAPRPSSHDGLDVQG